MAVPSLRARARALVDELNDFTTASAALQWLFEDLDVERQRVVMQVLQWQNRHADDNIATVRDGYDSEDSPIDDSIRGTPLLLVMGKPALLFATSIYDEELAMLVWRGLQRIHEVYPAFDLFLQVMDNTRDGHGLSSLHYAVEAQMVDFFGDVCGHLARLDRSRLIQALATVRSQDIVLPMAAKQVTGKSISSGGCTILHLACCKGELEIVKALLENPVGLEIDSVGCDWDGLSPYELAMLHHRRDVVSFLMSLKSFSMNQESLGVLQAQRDERATSRYTESMIARDPMTRREVFNSIWSVDECEQVFEAVMKVTSKRGWSKQRHTSYPTTDIPCYQVASVDGWVRLTVQERLFTQVYQRYGIPHTKMLTFRELFYVKYEAREGEQAELALHCDGSVLSFNILLNPASDFEGGGTYFEEANTTVHITQGDAVVHSGKVRHAGAAVTKGRRLILVGFLDLVDRVNI